MTSLSATQTVMAKTDTRCHATSCSDDGCSLSMEAVPAPYLLLNLEHPTAPVGEGAPRPDYLFVGGGGDGDEWVAPVELTKSAARVSKFLPQLRAGAKIAECLIPSNISVRFRPVAVYGGELRRSERVRFLRPASRVRFRNDPTPVKLVRCGSPLSMALRG